MTRARLALLAACLATAATACASATPKHVRDLDGNPLPPYALNDTAGPVLKVECEDGRHYLVLTDVPANLYAPALVSTYRFQQPGISSVCGRILVRR